MKIVVLDGYTLNPGDLTWDALEALGHCEIHDRTPSDEVVRRSRDADVLLTNKSVLDADALAQLPELKYIGVLATGYNVVDTQAAALHGVVVTNVPEYSTASVVQMVFAHILNFTNHVAEHSDNVHNGAWSQAKDFCFWNYPLIELQGKTMGIIGMGRIGSDVARAASAFGMNVLAKHSCAPSPLDDDIERASVEQVFARSDIISLHCPLTDDNRAFVNAELLSHMPSHAFLVNTGRGGLIDEQALADALNRGRLAGAGLDVLTDEPPQPDCPLLTARNCFITPHIAWATKSARERLMDAAVGNLQAFLAGNAINVVNGVGT